MTYLQLVNKVLVRLRENEVSTVNENSYSKLIGEYVNEAKNTVETAWDWTGLRTTLSVDTQANVFNYVLTDADSTIKMLDATNDSLNSFLGYKSSRWFDQAFLDFASVPKGTTQFYSINGINSVDLYPIPDKEYTLRFNLVLRKGDFTLDEEVLYVPFNPVVRKATALASRERGETGGTSAAELFALADDSLADAIAMDAALHPEETIWYS
jgi:hypothetical protein|tara:strand:- start:45 stop:677 length:633 start_codon:yes stop_codon:yes gene_type:complete